MDRLLLFPAKPLECVFEILGVGGRIGQSFVGDGMREGEDMGVQSGTQDQVRFGGTVEGIAQEGQPQRVRMYAYLVRAPGGGNCLEQRVAIEVLQNVESCLGWFPFDVIDVRSVAVPHVGTQRMAGGMIVPGGRAYNDGVVHLMRFVVLKEHIQRAVGLGAAGKNHQAAGDFVQTVDDPDAAIVRFQYIYQRDRVFFPTTRDGGEAGGFVHDKNGRVYV